MKLWDSFKTCDKTLIFSALEQGAEGQVSAASSEHNTAQKAWEEQAGTHGFASGLKFIGLFVNFIFNISKTDFFWSSTFNAS